MSLMVNTRSIRQASSLENLDQITRMMEGQLGDFEKVLGDTTQTGQSEMMFYLKLQRQMMAEQRLFQTLSNIMKARHDSCTNAIRNIR